MANAQATSMTAQTDRATTRLVAPPAPRVTGTVSLHPTGLDLSGPRGALLASLFGALAGIGLIYHGGQHDGLFVAGGVALLSAGALLRWGRLEVQARLARRYAELGLPIRQATLRAEQEASALCAELTRFPSTRAGRLPPIELD
jgi:hypothetical protein